MSQQKFSLKSVPGVYITLPKRNTNIEKHSSQPGSKKNHSNRFIIRQNFPSLEKDQLLESQLIANELLNHHNQSVPLKKINFTTFDGNNIFKGLMVP